MPDFDIDAPSPDAGHEEIRVAVLSAIEEAGYNTADVGLSLSLADVLFSLVDTLLVTVDDLTTRLTALEPPVFTETPGATDAVNL